MASSGREFERRRGILKSSNTESTSAKVPGDSFRTNVAGIWQVIREVPEHYEPRYSLEAPLTHYEGRLLVLKRLVDNKWKKSFAIEVLEESTLKPLSQADLRKLEGFRGDHQDLVEEFSVFNKPLDLILNLPFSLARKSDFRDFKWHCEEAFACSLKSGMSNDAILHTMAQTTYAAAYCQSPRNATLQFVCRDFEVKRRHFVYRQLNVCAF